MTYKQARDEAAEKYSTFEPAKWSRLDIIARDQYVGFKAGWDAATSALLEHEAVAELVAAIDVYLSQFDRDNVLNHKYLRELDSALDAFEKFKSEVGG